MAFPTKHAYGIRCDNGKEILLHIGMDTVDLQGEGFQSKVKVGDYVKQGDIIVEVDLDYVKKQGKSLISPVVFTDGTKIKMLKQHEIVQLKEAGLLAFI